MYNTTCKKGKRCINPPDMLKVAIGKKPKKKYLYFYYGLRIECISHSFYIICGGVLYRKK